MSGMVFLDEVQINDNIEHRLRWDLCPAPRGWTSKSTEKRYRSMELCRVLRHGALSGTRPYSVDELLAELRPNRFGPFTIDTLAYLIKQDQERLPRQQRYVVHYTRAEGSAPGAIKLSAALSEA